MGDINITLDVIATDAIKSTLIASANKANQTVKATSKEIAQQSASIMAQWSAFNQIANISLQLLAKATEGTKLQAAAQVAIGVLQTAQTQVSIAMVVSQALAATALHQYGMAAMLWGVAGAMELTWAASKLNEIEAKRVQQVAEALTIEINAYRS